MLSPLFGQLSPLRVPTRVAGPPPRSADSDVNAYILAVEAADGQELEAGVITAVENFVVGCKADGIWSAIKASCILAGARTLNGALVPLTGTAPTNFNFVSGDYNRETGLIGNGSTKYLDAAIAPSAIPQNSAHISAYQTQTSDGTATLIGSYIYNTSPLNASGLVTTGPGYYPRLHANTFNTGGKSGGASLGLFAANRSSSAQYSARAGSGVEFTIKVASSEPSPFKYFIFAGNDNGASVYKTAARLSFYSIGESLNYSTLSTRVSTLMTDLAAAI